MGLADSKLILPVTTLLSDTVTIVGLDAEPISRPPTGTANVPVPPKTAVVPSITKLPHVAVAVMFPVPRIPFRGKSYFC